MAKTQQVPMSMVPLSGLQVFLQATSYCAAIKHTDLKTDTALLVLVV